MFLVPVCFGSIKRKALAVSLLATAVFTCASAQEVRFWLSFEDPLIAALNGKQLGAELLPTTALGAFQEFTVGIKATGVSTGAYWDGRIMLAFDQLTSDATTTFDSPSAFNAVANDHVLQMASLKEPDIVMGPTAPGVDLNGNATSIDIYAGKRTFAGVAGSGSTLRPAGLWATIIFGGTVRLNLIEGVTVLLAKAKLRTNAGAFTQFGGIYGDSASETGLTLFVAPSTFSHSTNLRGPAGVIFGQSAKYAVSADVATLPIAEPDAYSVNEDTSLNVGSPGVLANDHDSKAAIVAAELTTSPLHALGFGLLSNGSFTYTPTAHYSGTDTFKYRCKSASGSFSAPTTVTIAINPTNDPPVIQGPTNTTIDELATSNMQFTATDPNDNPPNTPFTFQMISGPPGATMNANGLVTWKPTEAQGPGVYPITIKVTDSGTPALSTSLTQNITVREVNASPVLNAVTSQTIDELREIKFTASASDTDIPTQTIRYGLRNPLEGMVIDQFTGAFKWIPSEAQGPSAIPFYVTATDGVVTVETPVTLTVKEINSPPELQPIDDILTVGDQVVEFFCKVKDSDVPQNAYVFFLEGAPAGATLSVFDGHFRWIPPTVTTAQDYYFKIKVIDNGIPNMTSEQTVRITVVPTGTQSPIEGKITLQDFKISSEGQKVDFEVRNSLGVLLEVIPNISLGAGGSYSIMSNQTGTVSLSVRGLTWLTAARYPVTLGSAVAKVGFSLINGDVDGDDYVGTDDYIRLGLAFDSSVGDGNYDRNADLDGDGYVGTDDYLILNKNFDQQGM